MATVVTSDGTVFNMHRDLVDDCEVIKTFTEEVNGTIPLPNIDTETFIKVQYFFLNGQLENYDSVVDVIRAADYLAYKRLVDHCAEHIATKILKGKTPDQIRKYFEDL